MLLFAMTTLVWFFLANSFAKQGPFKTDTFFTPEFLIKFSEIVNEYNQFTRSKSATGSLIIDTISLFNNFCASSKNIFSNSWMGSISEGAESDCVYIK